MRPKIHNFKIKLDLNPCEDTTAIEMDGTAMLGVTDMTLRAGANGHTNLTVTYAAECAAEFAGSLIANIEEHNADVLIKLSSIYNKAEEITAPYLDGGDLKNDAHAKADFVRRVIELAIEDLS